jgi:hypothetical protein
VEIFMELNKVPPVGIVLKLLDTPVHRALPIFIAKEVSSSRPYSARIDSALALAFSSTMAKALVCV